MLTKTYSKGLLLWIDDSLNRNNSPNDPWREIFGDHSDRVYRLLDLSLDIAGSYKEAVDKIDGFNSYQSAGMFAYCVVDLRIPSDIGMIPELINGG